MMDLSPEGCNYYYFTDNQGQRPYEAVGYDRHMCLGSGLSHCL